MTIEDLDDWKYCGGNLGRHYNYWVLQYGNTPLPEEEIECVCYHPIKEQCYITNGEELLVLGNCCIQKFVAKCTRTCERCGDPHKNRIINRCNNCRDKGFCKNCKTKIDEKYTLCYTCKNTSECIQCGDHCNPRFKMCYSCYKFWEEFGPLISEMSDVD